MSSAPLTPSVVRTPIRDSTSLSASCITSSLPGTRSPTIVGGRGTVPVGCGTRMARRTLTPTTNGSDRSSTTLASPGCSTGTTSSTGPAILTGTTTGLHQHPSFVLPLKGTPSTNGRLNQLVWKSG